MVKREWRCIFEESGRKKYKIKYQALFVISGCPHLRAVFFYFLGGIFVNARILKDILDGWGKVSMPQSAVRRNSTYAKEFGWHMDESLLQRAGEVISPLDRELDL